MTARWEVAWRTDVGRERTRNEDHADVLPLGDDRWLLLLCDGMGGHADGDRASQTAVATMAAALAGLATHPEPYRAIHDAILAAHHAVVAAAAGSGMGATAVVAWLDGRRLWYGWVGDSRLYVLRGGVIIDRSIDHTRVQEMVASGLLRPDEIDQHPDAHVLTQALGHGEVRPTVFAEPFEALPGDVVLLCSDGLHDLVPDGELPALLEGDPADVTPALVEIANARGGHDNITVIVARRADAPEVASMAHPEPRDPSPADPPAARRSATVPEGPSPASPPAPSTTGPTPSPAAPAPPPSGAPAWGPVLVAFLVGMVVALGIVVWMVGRG